MNNERFSVSVNVTELGGGGDGSGPKAPGFGCFLVGAAMLLAIFGGIGNSVFSGNTMIYAPSSTSITGFPATAACLVGLCIILFFLCIVYLVVRASKGH